MYKYVLLIAAFLVIGNACEKKSSLHTITLQDTSDLQELFAYTGRDIPMISGHRGGAKNGFPENSIASMEFTLSHTPATFEVDPRLTKDSVIVLMHDETLDRTTNGSGNVSDYTWKELRELRLKDPEGNVTEHRIPSLDEVIRWARSKTVVNLDEKDVPKELTARKIREHEAEPFVIVTVHNAEEAKYYYEKNPDIKYSAWIRTKEAFEEYDKVIPWDQVAQVYIGPEINYEARELIKLLHGQGVRVMIGAGPSYDRLEPGAREAAYRQLIDSGVDIIETDRPVEAATTIGPFIPEGSSKQNY
jgi:glycerophosphoryl diester phosphodiesterase